MKRIAFRNARLIDPASGLDAKGGLLVENGRIADVGPRLFNDAEPNDPEVIDCRGLVLAPGLIDARVFTGEPGAEHRESLESASAAAAAGGVTSMIVMPNTDPVIDEPSLVDFILRRALSYAATFDALVISHAEDAELVKGASATEGEFATRLGLP
ncbi:MAG: dihydroorotase, partial [Alphaproteobacteria bacterium]|nr:dihydroorotase [Alphaproteobacteria bacterium]